MAKYINKHGKFLVFQDDFNLEIIEEKAILGNSFFDLSKEKYCKIKPKEIRTKLKNIELLKYDFTVKHIGRRRFHDRNLKKKIKLSNFSDKLCIRDTLKSKKVHIKNEIAVKLSKINFKKNSETMEEYNKILEEYGCKFEFLCCGIKKVNRYCDFEGNVVILKRTGAANKYHMLPLRKSKIQEDCFEKDEVLKGNEHQEFYVYEYDLVIQERTQKKRGRQKGSKIINSF